MIGRLRRLIEARHQQRVGDLRHRVAADIERTRLLMTATVIDARRIGAVIPLEIGGTIVLWAEWALMVEEWARDSE